MRDPDAKLQAGAINLWHAKYNTKEIATLFCLKEHVVANWIATYRDQTRERASA